MYSKVYLVHIHCLDEHTSVHLGKHVSYQLMGCSAHQDIHYHLQQPDEQMIVLDY